MFLYELYLQNGKQGKEYKHSTTLFISQNDETAKGIGENALIDTNRYTKFEVTKIEEVNGYSVFVEPKIYKS